MLGVRCQAGVPMPSEVQASHRQRHLCKDVLRAVLVVRLAVLPLDRAHQISARHQLHHQQGRRGRADHVVQADHEAVHTALAEHLDLGAEEIDRLVVPTERGVTEEFQRVAKAVAAHAFVHSRSDARAKLPDSAIKLLVTLHDLDAGEADNPLKVPLATRAAEHGFQTAHEMLRRAIVGRSRRCAPSCCCSPRVPQEVQVWGVKTGPILLR